MGLIPQSVIDEVVVRTDIVQVVGQYVSLKKAGANHKGLCPFHNEKTPSFNVNSAKGFYKCFGCDAKGGVVKFLMDMEGWNFPETVRHLAERAGIEIPEETDEEREEAIKRREAKKAYLSVMDLARRYYEAQLWSDAGRAARQYLQERGIDDETAQVFGLGYAPQGWQNLIDQLAKHEIPAHWVERAGLAVSRRGGPGFYDRFRHRITFPVVDIWDNTLAFGARILAADDDAPKYINSSETRFYTKGDNLYGLQAAKKAIQQQDHAIVVEGNFDVVALYASGVRNAVAPMGTAFTEKQATLLARYTRNVCVAFDGDSAGSKATMRSLPAFEEAGIEARVISLQHGEDPDSFVRRHGAPAFETLAAQAQDIVLWAFDQTLPAADAGDIRRNVAGAQAAAEVLSHLKNKAVRTRYVQELSRRLSIEPRVLNEYIGRPRALGDEIKRAVIAANQPIELDSAELGILTVLLDHPDWLEGFFGEEYDRLLTSKELADFLRVAQQQFSERGAIELPRLLQQIEHEGFRDAVVDALAESAMPQDDRERRFYEDCIRSLQRNWVDRALIGIQRELESTDFESERAQFEVLIEQQRKLNEYKQSLLMQ